MSPTRQAMFDRLAPQWSIAVEGPPLDLTELFGRAAPKVLEIGIGGGEALAAIAADQPDVDVIGIDVHTPGLATVLRAIERDRLVNVRLVDGDVLDFLPRLGHGSLDGIRIFFPDPWPKARQQRRRLVKPEVIDQLVWRLRPEGWIHLATDIDDYAARIEAVCGAHPALRGGVIERPLWRPVTRFEQRGLDAGRTPIDLWYRVI
jgi:tRNA (guanine-N7-)-methyltransferase